MRLGLQERRGFGHNLAGRAEWRAVLEIVGDSQAVRSAVLLLRLWLTANVAYIRSGHSLLHPPRPIDLSQAREAALEMELDLDEEEAVGTVMGGKSGAGANGSYAPVATSDSANDRQRGETVFDANASDGQDKGRRGVIGQGPGQVGYQAGRDGLNERDEEQWDRFS